MKIGILTQPLRTNYGGILQNYALQQILKSMGHSPITLDYDTRYTPLQWILGEIKSLIKGTDHNVEFPHFFRAGQENLNRFINSHIVTTLPCRGLPLHKFAKGIDAIIVGSDQVWRPMCNVPRSWLYEMFLDSIQNIDIPKISYAASFGSEEWEYDKEQTERCIKLINNFKSISVREDSGIRLCNDHLGRPAQHVLDPTMLLRGVDYDRFANKGDEYGKPTLFAYLLDSSKEKIDQIEQIAKDKQLDVYFKGANDDISRDDSIELWLSWIRNAKYVVTDSFHGSVFSILYHRPFNIYMDSWRGTARFRSLLHMVGCDSRGILKDARPDTSETIDWEHVDKRLANFRKHSIDYLEQNLHNA